MLEQLEEIIGEHRSTRGTIYDEIYYVACDAIDNLITSNEEE